MKSDNADILVIPPEPGSERAPLRSFRMVNELAQLECIYEGYGLTLDRVIAEETRYFAPSNDGRSGGATRPHDVVFFDNQLVAAIVRDLGDGKGSFKVLPIGAEWPDQPKGGAF